MKEKIGCKSRLFIYPNILPELENALCLFDSLSEVKLFFSSDPNCLYQFSKHFVE